MIGTVDRERIFICVVLLFAVSLACTSVARGQTGVSKYEDVFLRQAFRRPIKTVDALENNDHDMLLQVMDGLHFDVAQRFMPSISPSGGNAAFVLQDGSNNTSTTSQLGISNLTVLNQRGSANTTSIDQGGFRNIVGVRLTGDNNALEITQYGSNNTYVLNFEGSGLQFTGSHAVEQIGDGNHLVQIGRGSLPFSIRQRGNGMEMIIRHR